MQHPEVLRLIEAAQAEDLGSGDITASLMVDPGEPAAFHFLGKTHGVLAGVAIAEDVLKAYGGGIGIDWAQGVGDGYQITAPPCVLATIRGPVGAVLSAERVLLNFLQRLSGIASVTRRYVEAVAGTRAEVFDTRKTTPGWRTLEKYAVRCGGGRNHRAGLFDAVLVKDNHIAGVATSNLTQALADMLARMEQLGIKPDFVQVEVDTLEQTACVLDVPGVDSILLDNFSTNDLSKAVSMRDQAGLGGRLLLEASGGVTLATVGAIAATGIDRISVGALTHSAPSLDLSLERVPC